VLAYRIFIFLFQRLRARKLAKHATSVR